MACLPCVLLAGLPGGLGELTAQQKFDAGRYNELLGLYAKLAARAGALPASPEKTSVVDALNKVRVVLNQIGGVSVKSPGSATWLDRIVGYIPQSGSTGPDYMINPAFFDREYSEQMAEMNRIDQYLANLTAAPVVGKPQVSQPDVTSKPLTPQGSSGGAVYKTPDWSSYLPNPFNPVVPVKKPNYTNLIIVGAVIATGAYMLWPRKGR